MMWKHSIPDRFDYDTEEQFQEAISAYDAAILDYEDECLERCRERNNN